MLDVRSVGSDLSPEQLDETMKDVNYFLDAFGSTGAVRRKLYEQSSEIRQLRETVRRRLGNAPKSVDEDDGDDWIGAGEIPADEVDRIMMDVQFFLDTFGSTRNVRHRLESQRKEVIGLHRTVRFLEEYRRKRWREKLHVVIDVDNSTVTRRESEESFPRVRRDADNEMDEQEQTTANGADTSEDYGDNGSECTTGLDVESLGLAGEEQMSGNDESSNDATGGDDEATSVTARQEPSNLEHSAQPQDVQTGGGNKEQVSNSARGASDGGYQNRSHDVHMPIRSQQNPQKWTVCSFVNCTSKVQFNGLCCRHGGYRICKVDGCQRRAASRSLCRQHGGSGTKCKVPDCDKATSSKGYCCKHIHGLHVETNQEDLQQNGGNSRDQACKFDGCWHRAKLQGLCLKHGVNKNANMPPSSSTAYKRDGHMICKFPGCKRWGSQNSGHPLHCIDHQDENGNPLSVVNVRTTIPANADGISSSSSNNITRTLRVCKVGGCMKWAVRNGAQPLYCVDHQSWVQTSSSSTFRSSSTNKRRMSHKTCRVIGCMKWARGINIFCTDHQAVMGIEATSNAATSSNIHHNSGVAVGHDVRG